MHLMFVQFLLEQNDQLQKNWIGGGGGGRERENLKKKSKNIEFIYEPRHEISNNVVCATSKGSD